MSLNASTTRHSLFRLVYSIPTLLVASVETGAEISVEIMYSKYGAKEDTTVAGVLQIVHILTANTQDPLFVDPYLEAKATGQKWVMSTVITWRPPIVERPIASNNDISNGIDTDRMYFIIS